MFLYKFFKIETLLVGFPWYKFTRKHRGIERYNILVLKSFACSTTLWRTNVL